MRSSAELLRGGTFGPAGVELRETHGSWVFLTAARAFKVKKPVVLPFLDYGTLERRREMCRLEVEVNRRAGTRAATAHVPGRPIP